MELMQRVYRSLAVGRPTAPRLQQLLTAARRRNAHEGLTGLLVYDEGCFVQWLEGPPAGLERVWRSILLDPRHTGVEPLATPWRAERLFPHWSMQIGTAATEGAPCGGLAIDAAAAREVHASPERAALLLPGLSIGQRLPAPAELLRWSTEADATPWHRLAQRLAPLQPRLGPLHRHLFGPLTQALGDAWSADTLTAAEVLIALARMQSLLRQVAPEPPSGTPARGSALVAGMPGETHLFGVSFGALALHAEGWAVTCCFPADAAALLAELRQHRHDVLHLALSDSLPREHRLAELAALLRAARRASLQPQMQVLLSGRAFVQQPGLATLLGADGDALAQQPEGTDLHAMFDHAERRRHVPAMMVAQATLNDVALQIQRRRFGIPEEQAAAASAGGRAERGSASRRPKGPWAPR